MTRIKKAFKSEDLKAFLKYVGQALSDLLTNHHRIINFVVITFLLFVETLTL
jgi:hypothetical protein